MKKLLLVSLLAVSVIGCGRLNEALDTTRGLGGKMDDMNATTKGMEENLTDTGRKIYKQTVLVCKNDMLTNDNHVSDLAFALDTFPGAEACGEEATTLDLVKLTYLYIKYMNEETLSDDLRLADGTLPADKVKWLNGMKKTRFSVIRALAGFTPQKKVESLVQEQILSGGRYEDAAYVFLAFRAEFISQVLLELDLMDEKKPLNNPGKVDAALERVEALRYLSNLPFTDELKFTFNGRINDHGLQDPALALEVSFDKGEINKQIQKVKTEWPKKIEAKWLTTPAYQKLQVRSNSL